MKGCGETANHTRKPPAKYRVNIFQKYIYREKFDGRQATIAKWAFSDVVENQTNRTKIKNDACRLFRVGREKLLFLTQKRVEKEGCTRVENGTKSGRKGGRESYQKWARRNDGSEPSTARDGDDSIGETDDY